MNTEHRLPATDNWLLALVLPDAAQQVVLEPISPDPMASAYFVNIHLEIVSEGEPISVLEEITDLAHMYRNALLGCPYRAAVGGAAIMHVSTIHAAVGQPGIHPGNPHIAFSGSRNGQESLMRASGRGRYLASRCKSITNSE
jgi:hypothetical protein